MPQGQGLKQAEAPHARAIAPGENQMIQDGKVKRFRRARQLARRLAVGIARPGVAAGVVVGQHHAGASQPGGVDDDIPDRHGDRAAGPT